VFAHSTDTEPAVFTTLLAKRFLKPCVFAVVLARVGLAGARWIVAGAAYLLEKASKKLGFGNMSKNKHVKTQGFWTVDSPKPCISLHFLVAKWNFPGFLLDHLAPRRASWTHPQLDQKIVLFIRRLY